MILRFFTKKKKKEREIMTFRFFTKENDKYLSGNFKFVQRGDPPNKSYAQNSEV